MGRQPRVRFTKSSFSQSGDCVLWAHGHGAVFVSDSKDPGGLTLATSTDDWAQFTLRVGAGEAPGGVLRAVDDGDAWRVFLADDPDHYLSFSPSEWRAYRRAIRAGEVHQRAS
jgi:hypothetical protein